jgi:phosphoglycolate phosphatase-like HAD superfamily hydrolase
MTNLAIFDLDGTLVESNDIDTACFITAWRDVHEIDCSVLSWSSFENITDRGIAEALCELHFAVEERVRAYALVKSAFVSLLERAVRERPETCRAVSGALDLLEFLPFHNWRAVVATGAWADSAKIKMAAARFPEGIPVSSSEHQASRLDIVRSSIALAGLAYACEFDRIVLVGDAPWDVATAAGLSLPFVGRASGSAARKLSEVGAEAVLDDFADPVAVEKALRTAGAPRYTKPSAA